MEEYAKVSILFQCVFINMCVCVGHYRSDLRSYKRKHDGVDLRLNKRRKSKKRERYDSEYDSESSDDDDFILPDSGGEEVEETTDSGSNNSSTTGRRSKRRKSAKVLHEEQESTEVIPAPTTTTTTTTCYLPQSHMTQPVEEEEEVEEVEEEVEEDEFSLLDFSHEVSSKVARFGMLMNAMLQHEVDSMEKRSEFVLVTPTNE